jgi:hypothetical protein
LVSVKQRLAKIDQIDGPTEYYLSQVLAARQSCTERHNREALEKCGARTHVPLTFLQARVPHFRCVVQPRNKGPRSERKKPFLESFLRKGVSLGYVGRNINLKDLKDRPNVTARKQARKHAGRWGSRPLLSERFTT